MDVEFDPTNVQEVAVAGQWFPVANCRLVTYRFSPPALGRTVTHFVGVLVEDTGEIAVPLDSVEAFRMVWSD